MGFPGYGGTPQGYGFMHDHLGNIVEENQKTLREEAEKHFTPKQKDTTEMTKDKNTQVPNLFRVDDRELQAALKSAYGLGLRTGEYRDEDRLFVMNMSYSGSFRALTAPDVERYWFFDQQVPESLMFALADAAYYVPIRYCYKIMNSFNLTKPLCQRILDTALAAYPEKFTVVWGRDGASLNTQFVYYNDFDRNPVFTKGSHPFDILADIRMDMRSDYELMQKDTFKALEDIKNDTTSGKGDVPESQIDVDGNTIVLVDSDGVVTEEITFDPTDPEQVAIIEGLNDPLTGVFVG